MTGTTQENDAADGQSQLTAELGDCPCCGSMAMLKQVVGGDDDGGWFVECSNALCRLTTPLMFACLDDPRPTLIERWNRRVPNA